jgi:calcineurin-like phosphoesterase family protein
MDTPKGTKPPPNKRVFIVSDTHFGHANICRFMHEGSKIRPWDNMEEHDAALMERWNAVVSPSDKVYHLGDVCISRRSLSILERLNGEKILIRGNHDIFKIGDYTKHFKDVRAFHVLNGCVFTHAPIHPSCLEKFGCNVHGHTHVNFVKRPSDIGGMERDPAYLNVCVEHTDFSPIPLDEVFARIERQGGTVGMLKHRRSQPLGWPSE